LIVIERGKVKIVLAFDSIPNKKVKRTFEALRLIEK